VFTKEVRNAGISTLKNICQSNHAAGIAQMPESVNWTSSTVGYGTVGSLEESNKTSTDDPLSPPSNVY